MKLAKSLLLLAAMLFCTPAQAYHILHIPPDNLNLIFCGNGNVFPWLTNGPDAENMMHAAAIGFCQGTIIPSADNADVDISKIDVKRLRREQRPKEFSEERRVSPLKLPGLVTNKPGN